MEMANSLQYVLPMSVFGYLIIIDKEMMNMQILWGILVIMAGLFMLISGLMKSNFVIYRILVARSKILWGENVHRFYQISGAIVIVVGVLMTIGIIGG